MLAGILLLVPRFTTLGALLCAAVMSNVFMLNMSYDVPVKLFSFHLLVAALVLAGPDLASVARFFILRQPAQLAIDRPFFSNPRLNLAGLIAQLLFAAFLVGTDLYISHYYSAQYVTSADRPLLYGVWSITRANVDWQQVVFDRYGTFTVQPREGPMLYYSLKTNAKRRTITLSNYSKGPGGVLNFMQMPPNQLRLWGELASRRIVATLHRVDESKFLLLNRGFHWINEHPFNR
ncbi:MAG TPA: hypothetical protein VGG70_13595 [Candidatus Cybelea sp.]